jgi:hypothetical protein
MVSDDSSNEIWKYFLNLFSWRKPVLYITLVFSIGLYIYFFYIDQEHESFGIMERSKSTKVFMVCFVITFFLVGFFGIPFIQRIESIFVRLILFVVFSFIAILCMSPAWGVYEYDNQKLDYYFRVVPSKKGPRIKFKETLYFVNIVDIKSMRNLDTSEIIFLEKGNVSYCFDFANISEKSRNIFLVMLYNECEWLQNRIEKEFGPIDERKKIINSTGKQYFDFQHAVIFLSFIWLFIAEVVCLLAHTINAFKK